MLEKIILTTILSIGLTACSTARTIPPVLNSGDLEEAGAHCVEVRNLKICDYKKETKDSTSNDWEIYIQTPNGRLIRLTENSVEDSYPHSNGKIIVFQRVLDDKADVYSMKLNGKNIKKLTEKGNNWFPRISRDGKIAFVSDRDGNDEIYVMNIDGSNQTRITNNPGRDGYPRWVDGKLMYRNGDGPYHYVIIENGEHRIIRYGW